MNDMVKELIDKVRATATMAGEVAGQALDNAGKKAGDVWESTKLSLKLTDLGVERDALFRDIGRIVHQAHVDPSAPTDELDEKLAAVDAKAQEMDEIKAKMASMKKGQYCPQCGCLCLREDMFCRMCGTTLSDPPEEEQA